MSLEYCRSIIVRKTWKKSKNLNNSDFTEVRGTHGVMRIKGEKMEDVKYRDTLSLSSPNIIGTASHEQLGGGGKQAVCRGKIGTLYRPLRP